MDTTTGAPSHATTIDQHRGLHTPTGLRITQLHDVRTSFPDYFGGTDWDSLSADDRAEIATILEEIHTATVDLESLDADDRDLAKEYLLAEETDRPEDIASAIRRAIASATAKS